MKEDVSLVPNPARMSYGLLIFALLNTSLGYCLNGSSLRYTKGLIWLLPVTGRRDFIELLPVTERLSARRMTLCYYSLRLNFSHIPLRLVVCRLTTA